MRSLLTRFIKKGAAIGLAGLVLLLAGFVIPSVLLGYYQEIGQGIEEKVQTIARLRANIKTLQATTSSPGTSGAGVDRTAFVSGTSEAQALAALQVRIDETARQVGVRLQSVGSLPPRDTDQGLRLIGVRLQLIATLSQMHELIYALETSKPILLIDAADWSSATVPVGTEEFSGKPVGLEVQASLDVVGAYLPETSN
jgi:Type II secretion system (T2SS), protein M subtype b